MSFINMDLVDLLREKKPLILEKWFTSILDTYPPDTAKFLRSQKDRFANPVGAAIMQGIDGVFAEVIALNADPSRLAPFLDSIVRIRAVQEFSSSEAVSFIFLLKKIIRDAVGDKLSDLSEGLQRIDERIDTIALAAFDAYMKCREKIYEIKANEVRNLTFRLLQRANLICESEPDASGETGDVSGKNKIIQLKRGD